jgi:hypothetical protein
MLTWLPRFEIYTYLAASENAADMEYMFTELLRGTNLGDIWFDLHADAMAKVVTTIVEQES